MNRPCAILIPFTLVVSACNGPVSEPSKTDVPQTPVETIVQEDGKTRVILRGCAEGYQEKLAGNPLYDDERGLRLTCERKTANSSNQLRP